MSVEVRKRAVLLELAAEGIVPVVGGCAGALVGGVEGGVVGVAAGQALEKVINFFGGRIIRSWGDWFRTQPAEARLQALAELATLDPEEARREVDSLLNKGAPNASLQDRSVASLYLS